MWDVVPACASARHVGALSTGTCLQPPQMHLDGQQSSVAFPEDTNEAHEHPSSGAHVSESSSHEDITLPQVLYLAELGKPQKLGVFAVFNNSTDVSESCAGVASQFEWTWGEEEIALYDSPNAQYSDYLERCHVKDGLVKLTNLRALKGKGVHHESPLGIAPGSMLQQLMNRDAALRKKQ